MDERQIFLMRKCLVHEHHLRPLAELRDFFKLLYQSLFGMEHLIRDPHHFEACLAAEISSLTDPLPMPLIETITIIQPVARLNLSPFRRRQMPQKKLTEWCMESTDDFIAPSRDAFRAVAGVFCTVMTEDPFSFERHAVDAFYNSYPFDVCPPLHHSPVYRDLYEPHYRLVNPCHVDKYIGNNYSD